MFDRVSHIFPLEMSNGGSFLSGGGTETTRGRGGHFFDNFSSMATTTTLFSGHSEGKLTNFIKKVVLKHRTFKKSLEGRLNIYIVICLICIGNFGIHLNQRLISAALVQIRNDLEIGNTAISVSIALLSLGFMSSIVITSHYCNPSKYIRFISISSMIMSLASIICCFSNNVWIFSFSQFWIGFSEGIFLTVAFVYIKLLVGNQRDFIYTSLYNISSAAGAGFGVIIGGIAATLYSWRVAFVFQSLILGIVGFYTTFIPESKYIKGSQSNIRLSNLNKQKTQQQEFNNNNNNNDRTLYQQQRRKISSIGTTLGTDGRIYTPLGMSSFGRVRVGDDSVSSSSNHHGNEKSSTMNPSPGAEFPVYKDLSEFIESKTTPSPQPPPNNFHFGNKTPVHHRNGGGDDDESEDWEEHLHKTIGLSARNYVSKMKNFLKNKTILYLLISEIFRSGYQNAMAFWMIGYINTTFNIDSVEIATYTGCICFMGVFSCLGTAKLLETHIDSIVKTYPKPKPNTVGMFTDRNHHYATPVQHNDNDISLDDDDLDDNHHYIDSLEEQQYSILSSDNQESYVDPKYRVSKTEQRTLRTRNHISFIYSIVLIAFCTNITGLMGVSSSLYVFGPLTILMAFGVFAVSTPVNILFVDLVPREDRELSVATQSAYSRIFSDIIAIPLIGLAKDSLGIHSWIFILTLMGIVSTVCMCISFSKDKKRYLVSINPYVQKETEERNKSTSLSLSSL